MSYQIRFMDKGDIAQVHQLLIEFATFIGTPEKLIITPDRMHKDLGRFNCLIACEEDDVMGFASFFPAYYSWSGSAYYLDDLYVQPAHRGRGLGQALLDAVIAEAKKAGCHKLRWQVSRWNQRAISFYQKQGAMIDDVEINCDLILE